MMRVVLIMWKVGFYGVKEENGSHTKKIWCYKNKKEHYNDVYFR